MIRQIQDGYIYSTAVILFVTAMIKFSSVLSSAPVLDWLDPLLPITNRHVFVLAGMVEIGLSAFLFLGGEREIKVLSTAWLAVVYLIYRLGLWWAGASNLCHCLGNLTDRFPISPMILNRINWILLAWMIVGSLALLMIQWIGRWMLKTSSA